MVGVKNPPGAKLERWLSRGMKSDLIAVCMAMLMSLCTAMSTAWSHLQAGLSVVEGVEPAWYYAHRKSIRLWICVTHID